jgi:hypothetical protein
MQIAFQLVATLSLMQLSGCTNEYTQRDDSARMIGSATPVVEQAQSERAWLRSEVRSLRLMLTEREQREAEMWRAYTALVQQVSQMQTRQDPTVQKKLDESASGFVCIPSSTSSLASPTKNIVRAINHSRLNAQQKHQLFQSMRPPRPIDNVNPWSELSD